MAVIDDIVLIQMQRPGIDGTGISSAEKTQLVNDVAAALARANITKLTDVPDVNGTPTNGQVLQWSAANNRWEVSSLTAGISTILDGGSGVVSIIANSMEFSDGLTVTASESGGTVYPAVVFGGTGSANSVAHSDHTHTLRANVAFPFDASGTLSSGSRTLISGTVSGLDPLRTYIISADLIGDLRGGGTGAGYTLPRITIGSVVQDRFGGTRGEVRTVSGVDREYSMDHPGATVTGVTSVAVSATTAYRSGDPIIVGAGELTISIKANR